RHQLPPAQARVGRARDRHRRGHGQAAHLARDHQLPQLGADRARARRGRRHRDRLAGARLPAHLHHRVRPLARRRGGLAGRVAGRGGLRRRVGDGDPGPAQGPAPGPAGGARPLPRRRAAARRTPDHVLAGGVPPRPRGRPLPGRRHRQHRTAGGPAMTPLTPARARQVFLLLTLTRWFPVGLVVTVTTLLPLERGLTVTETLTALSFTGLTVFLLELPTSGLADSLGRKPLLVTAAVLQVGSGVLFLAAQSFWAFVLAAVATGAFRALDSGPLEAWFVDTVHATTPGADVDRPLAAQGTVMGVSMAAGALVSGGLVWWHPFTAWSALALPYAAY